jgi:RNA polymerase sigma factor (sigma-70 family)
MSGGDPSGALRDIRTLFGNGRLADLSDRQLLERFVSSDDSEREDAFAMLLERHGPMVWGVCRRLLPDRDDAADAFQATFLVLVRRVRCIRADESLGPWLFGVSRRVAARARARALRRRSRETGEVEAVASPAPDPDRFERLAILDEEIGRLPERESAVVVLCDLEGLPHEEAARRLGCPVGTVESRLSRGRQRLRDRLVRRGLAPAAAAMSAELAREASAAMPLAIIKNTIRFVTSSLTAGAMPATVTALAEGVIQMMWLARLKPLVAVAATLILATAGVAVQGRQKPAAEGVGEQAKTAPAPTPGAGAAVPDLAATRAIARQQLALIDQAWAMMSGLARTARMDIHDAAFSMSGRRRLEALHRAGAGKAEIVAALEKYINELKAMEAIAKAQFEAARASQLGMYEFQFLRMEAEIWLHEEKAR